MTEPPDRRLLIINTVGAPSPTRTIRLALARIIHATRKPDDTLLIEVCPWRNEGIGANVSFCARRPARCLTFSLLIS